MTVNKSCFVCGAPEPRIFADVGRVPVQCTALYASRDDALAAPAGAMELVVCSTCTTVTNQAFDEALVEYDGDYENSQLFSPTFREFAEGLARRLVEDNGLHGRPVVEVGSGKGEFLAMLAEAGAGRATGYDPTYGGEVDHLDPSLDIHLERRFFDATSVAETPSLVCLRHVLEHVRDPVGLLSEIRNAVKDDPECLLYVEVPNGEFTFTPSGLWDIIYQHCSYFTASSLRWVANAAGLEVVSLDAVFGGQFLALEARPAAGATDGRRGTGPVSSAAGSGTSRPSTSRPGTSGPGTSEAIADFPRVHERIVAGWRERMQEWVDSGLVVALWGAGAKGVTFLNTVGSAVGPVVDLNVRKHGRFLPGTGHRVTGPEDLRDAQPDVVVVMNAAYEPEIRAALESLGLAPRIVVA